MIASVSESASRCSSVSMGWLRTTCLLCATLHPDSLDARICALRIADSSTFHALHCRRAVFEPSRMLVHLCGTLWPFISRTAIWLLQLSCAILSLISSLSTDFVLSAFGGVITQTRYMNSLLLTTFVMEIYFIRFNRINERARRTDRCSKPNVRLKMSLTLTHCILATATQVVTY